tara:strand:- start:871 stop:1587 length:717 start_codon:yes stop_codon:yes gene_type:complete
MALTKITKPMMADESIDSDQYVDGSIDNAHIADDAIDSEHYAAGSIDEAHIADNAVSLAKMAGGTDGQIISYDASGDPVALGPGTDGQVLTSTGAGSPPAFEAIPASAGNVYTGHYYTNPLNAPGAHAVTGVGFEPDSLFAMQIENRGKCGMSWGFATQSPSDNGCMTSYNVSTNDTGDNQQRYDSQQSHIFYLWQDASNHVQATVTSWDADGFTFTITETGSLTVPAGGFMFMALKM